MVKLQACEPTHVVTEQNYEQGKKGGADVERKGGEVSFHAGRITSQLGPSGGLRGPIRWLQEPVGPLGCRWVLCGRRPVSVVTINLHLRPVCRHPTPSARSETFSPSFLMMVH